jgi:hypothetical protein
VASAATETLSFSHRHPSSGTAPSLYHISFLHSPPSRLRTSLVAPPTASHFNRYPARSPSPQRYRYRAALVGHSSAAASQFIYPQTSPEVREHYIIVSMDQTPTSPGSSRPRPRSRGISFASNKSGESQGSKQRAVESPSEKARRDSLWRGATKANPNAAINESQPGGMLLGLLHYLLSI